MGALIAVRGEAAPPMSAPPVEVFFKPAAVQHVELSPSGKRMALSVPATKGRVALFVIDLQGQDFKATRAVQFSDGDVSSFYWVNDERLVFQVTDLQSGLAQADEVWPGLYAARYDGTDLTYLVDIQGRPPVSHRLQDRTLEWNHWLLHVPEPSEASSSAGAEEVIVGEVSFSDGVIRRMKPMWLNTRTARTRPVATESAPCPAVWWWFSPQGEPRLIRCSDSGRESLHAYRPSGDGRPGRWQRIAEGPVGRLTTRGLWIGDDKLLYVAHEGGPAGESVVAPFDFDKNLPGETLVNAPGFDFKGRLIGDREGKRLLGVRITTDAEQTVWFDAAHKAAQQRADQAMPGRVNRITCRRCGNRDAVMLVNSFSDRDPGQLLLWRQGDNEGKGAWLRIGQVRPDIKPEQMAETELHRIRARDSRDLPVWITRTPGTKTPRPAVVLVHGGPWVRGRTWDWEALPQFLASRGFVVIEPEFRGSAGYGEAHLRAGFKQWGQAMQDDVADAVLWARQHGYATDKACIAGESYGGYSALMGLIRHPELYRCGSAWVAPTDLLLVVDGSWRVNDNISNLARRYILPEMVGDAERDREMLVNQSPLTHAARITKPLQLIWGSGDLRVPVTHGRRLREAMQKAGREPEWVVYTDEAHGWRKPENQIDFARKLEAFLARHLN